MAMSAVTIFRRQAVSAAFAVERSDAGERTGTVSFLVPEREHRVTPRISGNDFSRSVERTKRAGFARFHRVGTMRVP